MSTTFTALMTENISRFFLQDQDLVEKPKYSKGTLYIFGAPNVSKRPDRSFIDLQDRQISKIMEPFFSLSGGEQRTIPILYAHGAHLYAKSVHKKIQRLFTDEPRLSFVFDTDIVDLTEMDQAIERIVAQVTQNGSAVLFVQSENLHLSKDHIKGCLRLANWKAIPGVVKKGFISEVHRVASGLAGQPYLSEFWECRLVFR